MSRIVISLTEEIGTKIRLTTSVPNVSNAIYLVPLATEKQSSISITLSWLVSRVYVLLIRLVDALLSVNPSISAYSTRL